MAYHMCLVDKYQPVGQIWSTNHLGLDVFIKKSETNRRFVYLTSISYTTFLEHVNILWDQTF